MTFPTFCWLASALANLIITPLAHRFPALPNLLLPTSTTCPSPSSSPYPWPDHTVPSWGRARPHVWNRRASHWTLHNSSLVAHQLIWCIIKIPFLAWGQFWVFRCYFERKSSWRTNWCFIGKKKSFISFTAYLLYLKSMTWSESSATPTGQYWPRLDCARYLKKWLMSIHTLN